MTNEKSYVVTNQDELIGFGASAWLQGFKAGAVVTLIVMTACLVLTAVLPMWLIVDAALLLLLVLVVWLLMPVGKEFKRRVQAQAQAKKN